MAGGAQPTAFVTGAAGFIGTALVRLLLTQGFQVFGLARSPESMLRLQRMGAVAIEGDLLVPGRWQDEVATDWVFHLPPHTVDERAAMDRHLLDAVADCATRRIVYLADCSGYDTIGVRPITEDELQPAYASGCLSSALDRVDGYLIAGLPIVTALPGCVYGNGGWFRERVIDPVLAGRRVLQFDIDRSWVSPIHVHDCARALLHLAARGDVGSRYFVANTEPVQLEEFARTFARLADRPLRVWRVSPAAARWFFRSPLGQSVRRNTAFANIRLRGTGFQFSYPTLEHGVDQILGDLNE